MKWRRSCNQFPSFMSEPNLSTRSKICMHLEKFKFFSSHPRPETHFSHVQGHQLSSALTGSNNFLHSTIFTVYKITHLKKFNTKLRKQPVLFSGVNKKLYHYFQGKKAGWHKKTESKNAFQSSGVLIDLSKSTGWKVKAFLNNRPK